MILSLGEHIARAAHGDDAARMFGVVLNGGAQSAHMHVNGAIQRGIVGLRLSASQFRLLLARQHTPGALRHGVQQRKLVAGERPLATIHTHGAGVGVNLQSAKTQRGV